MEIANDILYFDSFLAATMCVVGVLLNEGLEKIGLQLPLFVTCLFAGILLTNLIPENFQRFSGRKWPTRKPSIALIAVIILTNHSFSNSW